MKTNNIFHLSVAVALLFGVFASSGQTSDYLYSGSEQTITLNPGLYDITAYGAQGGSAVASGGGGLGAEMAGQFSFASAINLTILVGGSGDNSGGDSSAGGGGGGGTFVVNGSIPLVIAGGGGGGGFYVGGASGNIGTDGTEGQNGGGNGGSAGDGGSGGGAPTGGGGGGGYSGGGGSDGGSAGGSSFLDGGAGGNASSDGGGNGGFGGGGGGGGGYGGGGGGGGYSGGGGGASESGLGGGGGGSYIDPSAVAIIFQSSGTSPNDSPNGEIIITAVPEPSASGLLAVGVAAVLLLRRVASVKKFHFGADDGLTENSVTRNGSRNRRWATTARPCIAPTRNGP